MEVFTYADVYEAKLPFLEPLIELREPCNCWELHGAPMCNNGGNYHSIIKIFKINETGSLFLVVFTDTREFFSEYEVKYIVVNGGVVRVKDQDGYTLSSKEELEELIEGCLRDGYRIYYAEE
jgi:hypothetical protein